MSGFAQRGRPRNPLQTNPWEISAEERARGAETVGRDVLNWIKDTIVRDMGLDTATKDFQDTLTKSSTMGTPAVKKQKTESGAIGKKPAWVTPDASPQSPKRKKAQNTRSNTPSAPEGHRRIVPVSNMSGNAHNNGDDIPVIPPPRKIAKHVPDYTTIKLTYFDYVNLVEGSGNQNDIARHYIRLNSIYDIAKSAAATAATEDIDGALPHAPAGRAVWENIYKYYRVLSTDVTLTYVNNSAITYSTTGADEYTETPILVGYIPVEGESDSTAPQNWYHWVERKHSKAELMDPGWIKNTTATATFRQPISKGLGMTKIMKYHYEPGKWDYHVTDNAEDERWTLLTKAPEIARNLCVMACKAREPAGAGNFATGYDVRCYYHMNITVQLRELKDDILYKTDSAPSSGD